MPGTLKQLSLINFRTFTNFTVKFDSSNFLIGPNNAGKTTLLTALRIADMMLRHAMSRNSTHKIQDDEKWVSAYYTSLGDYQSVLESVHHNFESSEARLELSWSNGNKLIAVWPPIDADTEPYFYLLVKRKGEYVTPTSISKVREEFERLGVIPLMSPIEHRESLLKSEYVKSNIGSKLASRHFRNNLYALYADGLFDNFADFLVDWMPDISLKSPEITLGDDNQYIDVYYREDDNGPEKELAWSGDGIQIWLQILFHIFRIGTSKVIILDEPEVYLHADLQRRLVRLLNSLDVQIIVATHSSEVISEIDSNNIIMIDKSRKAGIRVKNDIMLDTLSESVGTSFNLRLAKALKTRAVLFVEGKDMKLLSVVCSKLGLKSLEREYNITTIMLDGKSGSKNVVPFKWLHKNMLSNTKQMFVVLDRDYQSEQECTEIEKSFHENGVHAHIWRRKELESYFINSSVISRILDISISDVEQILLEASNVLENKVLSQIVDDQVKRDRKDKTGKDISITFMEVKDEFDKNWKKMSYRVQVTPAKKFISQINVILDRRQLPTISAKKLVACHNAIDIPDEMADVLRMIDMVSKDTLNA